MHLNCCKHCVLSWPIAERDFKRRVPRQFQASDMMPFTAGLR